MKLRNLYEASGKTASFALGRMNPATNGHELLVNAVKAQPGDSFLFLTDRAAKLPTDPLSSQEKLDWARKSFDGISIALAKNISLAAHRLYKLGYTEVTFLEGERKLYQILVDYNGKTEGKRGPIEFPYKFDKINYVQLERDAQAADATGMSGTKLRGYVENNDLEGFKSGVTKLAQPHAEEMFMKLRQIMGQRDESTETDLDEILGFTTRRQPRATRKVKTLKIDDKALSQKVQDRLKQIRKDQAKKEGIELDEAQLDEFVGNAIKGGGWIIGQLGKLVGQGALGTGKVIGKEVVKRPLSSIGLGFLGKFYLDHKALIDKIAKYGIPAAVVLFLLMKGKDIYDYFAGEDIEDADSLDQAITKLHQEELSFIKKKKDESVDIGEEEYDTQRDADAVSGKPRRTSIGKGKKPKGYSKDKAEKAAVDNIKKALGK